MCGYFSILRKLLKHYLANEENLNANNKKNVTITKLKKQNKYKT